MFLMTYGPAKNIPVEFRRCSCTAVIRHCERSAFVIEDKVDADAKKSFIPEGIKLLTSRRKKIRIFTEASVSWCAVFWLHQPRL